jgi:tetratricopeptide (TPR) repeat protein
MHLLLTFHAANAAENFDELDQLRKATLQGIEQLKAVQPTAGTVADLASYYGELASRLEGYLLNGLSRSEEETTDFYREAYTALVNAARYSSVDYGFSSKISDYAVKLGDIELLHSYFLPVLETERNENYLYIARIDYATGLEKFGFLAEAETLLRDAIRMRPRADAYEAKYHYIQLLTRQGRDFEALEVIESMTSERRNGFNSELLYLEKSVIEKLGYDETHIDIRIDEFYDRTIDAMGVVARRPPLASVPSYLKLLGIARANAYSHSVAIDDSRGTAAGAWWVVNPNLAYSRVAINAGEVLYQEN